jgi:hypothetical protein
MALEDTTKRIKAFLAGAEIENYRAGRLLNEVEASKSYKEGFKSFHAYLLSLVEKKKLSWVYKLLTVALYFAESDAPYGIENLYDLYGLQQAAFPAQQPSDLLRGTHTFKDPDGVGHVLDFQQDHTRATLEELLALFHARHKPNVELHTNEAQWMDKVLRQDKKDGVMFSYSLRERPHEAETLIQLTLEGEGGVFDTLFDDLSEGDS